MLPLFFGEESIANIMSKSGRKSKLPAKPSHGYEFGGPLGAFAISFVMPLVCYLAAFLCNDISGCPVTSTLHPQSLTLAKLKAEAGRPADGILALASLDATAWLLAYYLFSLILQTVLPGVEVEGPELQSGGKLKYKLNGAHNSPRTLYGYDAD